MEDTKTCEISLSPLGGFVTPYSVNGVQIGSLRQYVDSKDFPNVAVIDSHQPWAKVLEAINQFRAQRSVVDAIELILAWLAFTWGVGRTGNPLLEGFGIPGAVFAEYVLGSVGLELTPGLASRSSCPEAIWQSARWWHLYHDKHSHALHGFWCIDHRIV